MTNEDLNAVLQYVPADLLRTVKRDGVTKDNVGALFNVWITRMFKDELQWVENVQLVDTSIVVEHSYPEGIDIRPHVRDIVRKYYQGQEMLELVLKRVEPR